MRKLNFHLVDVFTDRPFGGNQLAVFTNAEGLEPEMMQALAKEMNLSESVFVVPATTPGCHFRLRIFTPAMELPMAGHPTVGTAFVLALAGMFEPASAKEILRLQEGVGPIEVRLDLDAAGRPGAIWMSQPLPQFGPVFTNRDAIAELLSVDLEDLEPDLPLETVSCGVPFLMVPLKSLKAIRNVKVRLEIWERVLQHSEAPHIFTFCHQVENQGSTVHSRMFAPAMGIAEDAATGGASGPLGCYLVRYGFGVAGVSRFVSEQGIELGRPSFINIEISSEDGNIASVQVGGHCYYMGQGQLILP